jgi:hypothetical protein
MALSSFDVRHAVAVIILRRYGKGKLAWMPAYAGMTIEYRARGA